jgi:16S rRNA processing protein RimM
VGAAAKRHPVAQRPETEQGWGSGEQARDPEPRYLAIGQVVGAHGLYGELKVEILTDDPHRFGLLGRVLIGPQDQEPVSWILERYRLHKGRALVKLEGCDDRNTAETFRGLLLQIPIGEAIPLQDDEYFEHQILGLAVWTASGEPLGRVADILYTGANDVYVVQSTDPEYREILIPAMDDVVLEIDTDAGKIVVELPEGLR